MSLEEWTFFDEELVFPFNGFYRKNSLGRLNEVPTVFPYFAAVDVATLLRDHFGVVDEQGGLTEALCGALLNKLDLLAMKTVRGEKQHYRPMYRRLDNEQPERVFLTGHLFVRMAVKGNAFFTPLQLGESGEWRLTGRQRFKYRLTDEVPGEDWGARTRGGSPQPEHKALMEELAEMRRRVCLDIDRDWWEGTNWYVD